MRYKVGKMYILGLKIKEKRNYWYDIVLEEGLREIPECAIKWQKSVHIYQEPALQNSDKPM